YGSVCVGWSARNTETILPLAESFEALTNDRSKRSDGVLSYWIFGQGGKPRRQRDTSDRFRLLSYKGRGRRRSDHVTQRCGNIMMNVTPDSGGSGLSGKMERESKQQARQGHDTPSERNSRT